MWSIIHFIIRTLMMLLQLLLLSSYSLLRFQWLCIQQTNVPTFKKKKTHNISQNKNKNDRNGSSRGRSTIVNKKKNDLCCDVTMEMKMKIGAQLATKVSLNQILFSFVKFYLRERLRSVWFTQLLQIMNCVCTIIKLGCWQWQYYKIEYLDWTVNKRLYLYVCTASDFICWMNWCIQPKITAYLKHATFI